MYAARMESAVGGRSASCLLADEIWAQAWRLGARKGHFLKDSQLPQV